jgi:hypothetical protein
MRPHLQKITSSFASGTSFGITAYSAPQGHRYRIRSSLFIDMQIGRYAGALNALISNLTLSDELTTYTVQARSHRDWPRDVAADPSGKGKIAYFLFAGGKTQVFGGVSQNSIVTSR